MLDSDHSKYVLMNGLGDRSCGASPFPGKEVITIYGPLSDTSEPHADFMLAYSPGLIGS